jgi:hypothetical protein
MNRLFVGTESGERIPGRDFLKATVEMAIAVTVMTPRQI